MIDQYNDYQWEEAGLNVRGRMHPSTSHVWLLPVGLTELTLVNKSSVVVLVCRSAARGLWQKTLQTMED